MESLFIISGLLLFDGCDVCLVIANWV